MVSREKMLEALSAIGRYASAVLAVVCALAIRLALIPLLADRAPYLFFLLAIVVVKRLWGRGPALLATLLGGIAAWYFIIEPRFSFVISSRAIAFNLAVYFAVGVSVSFLGEGTSRWSSSLAVAGRSITPRLIRQTAVLAGAAVVLAGMVLLLLRDFARTRDAEGWVVHAYQVINSAESLLSTMQEAETGERGYLLTGDKRYLAPYNAAVAALPRGLEELKSLTSDNPAQQARLVEINRLTGERMRVLKHTIEARDSAKGDTALALVRFGRGEPAMDELRSALDAVMSDERNLLGERTAEAEVRASRGRWILGLGSAALILLLVFASVVIERETLRREEITQAVRRHADLLEQAHDSLFTWLLGGAINYWSRGAETLFGYTREEALGRSSHGLLHTQHPLGMAQLDALVERDGQWNGELTQTTKDGRKLTVEARWVLAVDAQGNKTVLEANRDITGRKQVERALEESELRYRQLFERSESALAVYEMVYDGQGNPCDYRYIHVNPAFERVTGRTGSQILGRTAREVTPDIEEYWIKLFGQVAATGTPASFEHYARHLARYYSGNAYSPRPQQVAVTFMDVTERKEAEEKVRQLNIELEERVRQRTAALEAANRELEAFARSVSHDLRAPLRGIDGWSQALLEDYGERLDAQGKKYLDRVRSEAQRMDRLIDDLLHLSHVSRAELVPGAVDLTRLAESIVARLKEAHPGRCIEYTVAPEMKCTGDARLLEVALTNLLDNAVKFTGPRATARVEVGKSESNGNICYFVRDNGVGFDMSYAKLLFAPFQRLHKVSEFPGTGIGLATVQRVIHRHGGRVWGESKVGAGATFYFTLGETKA